jgi:hypothetical protein
LNPHCVPSQVATAFSGVEHGVHDVAPQLLGLLFAWQLPLQSCVPAEQVPRHDCPVGMQDPAHSFVPLGQVPPHDMPSQVAAPPPEGTAHGVQDDPHDATSVLDEHCDPHV